MLRGMRRMIFHEVVWIRRRKARGNGSGVVVRIAGHNGGIMGIVRVGLGSTRVDAEGVGDPLFEGRGRRGVDRRRRSANLQVLQRWKGRDRGARMWDVRWFSATYKCRTVEGSSVIVEARRGGASMRKLRQRFHPHHGLVHHCGRRRSMRQGRYRRILHEMRR